MTPAPRGKRRPEEVARKERLDKVAAQMRASARVSGRQWKTEDRLKARQA